MTLNGVLNSAIAVGKTVFFGGIVVVGVLFYQLVLNQNRILYHPTIPGITRINAQNMVPLDSPANPHWGGQMYFENLKISAPDGVKLHGWLLRAPRHVDYTSAPTIVYSHQNAGNLGVQLPRMFEILHTLGCNILLWSYRGYGESEGDFPSEEGILLDIQGVMTYLKSRKDLHQGRMFAFGSSLGGAVSIRIVTSNPDYFAGLILENTFTSISDMVDVLLPWFSSVKNYFLRIKWDSINYIDQVTCPILFISGLQDELVPASHMKKLYDHAKSALFTEMYMIPDGKHNDTPIKAGAQYPKRIEKFVYNALKQHENAVSIDAVRPLASSAEYRAEYDRGIAKQAREYNLLRANLVKQGKPPSGTGPNTNAESVASALNPASEL